MRDVTTQDFDFATGTVLTTAVAEAFQELSRFLVAVLPESTDREQVLRMLLAVAYRALEMADSSPDVVSRTWPLPKRHFDS